MQDPRNRICHFLRRILRFSFQGQASRMACRRRHLCPRAQRWHPPGDKKQILHDHNIMTGFLRKTLSRAAIPARPDGTSSPSFDHGCRQPSVGCFGLEWMMRHFLYMHLFMVPWLAVWCADMFAYSCNVERQNVRRRYKRSSQLCRRKWRCFDFLQRFSLLGIQHCGKLPVPQAKGCSLRCSLLEWRHGMELPPTQPMLGDPEGWLRPKSPR